MGRFIVSGLATGVIYGLAGLGLVLIYKGTRVFNFAQGEFGTVAMYMLYYVVEANDGPYALGMLAGLIAAVALALLTERLVARPLASAPKVIALVGTAGFALFTIGIELAVAKPEPRSVAPAIGGGGVPLFGFIVSGQKILALIVLVIVAVAAGLFFQRTYLGMGILANSQDSVATRIMGANANRISQLTWAIAGLLGGIAGVLLAPESTIVPGYMTSNILIPAFTAAVVGGMTSLPGAFVAGEIIGLVEGLGQYAIIRFPGLEVVPEGQAVLLFAVLIVTLVVRPNGLFGSEA